MKKIIKTFLIILFSFIFVGIVNAENEGVYYAIDHNGNIYKQLTISNYEIPGNHISSGYYSTTEFNIPPWASSYTTYQWINKVTIGGENDIIKPQYTNLWFYGMKNLETVDLTYLDTSNVVNMSEMFQNCEKLKSIDLSGFDTSKVTNMTNMFLNCISLTNLDLSSFNTSNVITMQKMFYNCSNLESINLSSFNTKNVTTMEEMFYNCNSLKSLNLSSFNTTNVTSMKKMFENCSSLTSLDLSNFSTSNVTNMWYMFAGASSLKNLNISSFDTSNVTDMSDMFSNCSSLTSLDLRNFNTSKVTHMSGMFSDCTSLISLNLSSFDSREKNMSNMFINCSSLISLDLSNFMIGMDSGQVNNMLEGCISLKYLKTPYMSIFGAKRLYLPHNMASLDHKEYEYIEWDTNDVKELFIYNKAVLYMNDASEETINYVFLENERRNIENPFNKTGYSFVSWNTKADGTGSSYTDEQKLSLTEDITLYAQWQINKYNVTFVDDDEVTILKNTISYEYGTPFSSIEKPEDPIKQNTAEYTYSFSGWTPYLEDVSRDIVYVATYSKIKNRYWITWTNYDGSALESNLVEYGEIPIFNGSIPIREGDSDYLYEFLGWDKEITSVKGDTVYKAVFNTIKLIPVYRMFNPGNGEHLYTTDAHEVNVIYETQGWGFEGIGWYTTDVGIPVYRLYNPVLGNHLYTSDQHEIDIITSTQGWVLDFDGEPVMYSYGDIPIYRLFNPGLQGQHHLTTDLNEYNIIPMWGWQQEGISMNAVSSGIPVTTYYFKDSKKIINFIDITSNILD